MADSFKDRLNKAISDRDIKPAELARRTGINKSSIPEGFEWVIFDLKATLDEGSADDPFNTVNLSVTPVASDGSEVAQPFYATFETGTDFGFKDLYQGGTDEGKKGLIVPVGDETLVEITDWNTSVFFKLN